MKKAVVDTNVPLVANGKAGNASNECRLACIELLEKLRSDGCVVLDDGRELLDEYNRRLSQTGQPGVGDLFYRHLLVNQTNRHKVQVVKLKKHPVRGYVEFPDDPSLKSFDPADRKFAAAARVAQAPVANATDSDWHHHASTLKKYNIKLTFVCGREIFKESLKKEVSNRRKGEQQKK